MRNNPDSASSASANGAVNLSAGALGVGDALSSEEEKVLELLYLACYLALLPPPAHVHVQHLCSNMRIEYCVSFVARAFSVQDIGVFLLFLPSHSLPRLLFHTSAKVCQLIFACYFQPSLDQSSSLCFSS